MKYLYTLFFLGLILRLALSYHMGNHDSQTYYLWGRNVFENGLSWGYSGVYFPIQYQFFSSLVLVADILGTARWIVVFKIFTLLFDTGIFFLLIKILNKFQLSKNYALIFWLHPWFLLTYSQGFVDAQFTFFILLTILLMFRVQSSKIITYIIPGIPFAIAFLMKPQVIMPAFVLFIFFSLLMLIKKELKYFLFFVPSVLLFASYSIYFALEKSTNFLSGILFLFNSYTHTLNDFPCLTCSLPNFWYPIATFFSKGEPIYSVSSKIAILPGITADYLVLVSVILIIFIFSLLLVREKKNVVAEKILRLLLFISLIIPFIMVGAHINHPYLGTVLLILYLAKYKSKLFNFSGHLLLLALSAYLYVSYGFGMNYGAFPSFLHKIPLVLFSYATIVGFGYTLYYIYTKSNNER